MKKLIKLALAIPFLALLLILGIANRQDISLHFDPINIDSPIIASWTMPLYVLVFALLVIGLLLGAAMMWFAQHKYRKKAKLLEKRFEGQQKELVKTKQDLASVTLEHIS